MLASALLLGQTMASLGHLQNTNDGDKLHSEWVFEGFVAVFSKRLSTHRHSLFLSVIVVVVVWLSTNPLFILKVFASNQSDFYVHCIETGRDLSTSTIEASTTKLNMISESFTLAIIKWLYFSMPKEFAFFNTGDAKSVNPLLPTFTELAL